MGKKFKKIINRKLFIWGIIPLSLIFLWAGLTFWYIVRLDTAFSLLSYNENNSSFVNLNYKKLLKGNSLRGKFVADDNNLGIVSIRFQTFFRPAFQNEDKLLFRIKKEGAKKWYYQSIYSDGIIYDVPFFPFGFPVIFSSKGKIYEFQITSLNGNENNSVALSDRGQILTTKYKYTKSELLHNRKLLFIFSLKKFVNAIQTTDVLFSSFVYFLPLIFYITLLFFKAYIKKKLRKVSDWFEILGKNKIFIYLFPKVKLNNRGFLFIFDFILFSASFIDMFFLQLGNNVVYILIPMLWIIIQRALGVSSKSAFLIGILLLFIPPFFITFKLEATAEQVAVWAYLFLCAGLIQALMELKE